MCGLVSAVIYEKARAELRQFPRLTACAAILSCAVVVCHNEYVEISCAVNRAGSTAEFYTIIGGLFHILFTASVVCLASLVDKLVSMR